ncbi:MAG: glycoside hydrolase family 25 protein [Chitinophagaceae bacterium]|jgi:lysozyme|nr:glycoside hydrolase family 25 protein [Chitinophagaceae bacterium]
MAKRKRRKISRKTERWLWLILLAIGAGWIFYLMIYRKWEDAAIVLPGGSEEVFGVKVPQGYPIHGIDVSSYQGQVNWQELKATPAADVSLRFAFVKATEGLNDTDKMFVQNWNQLRLSGITRGAYHFFLATKSGKQQALQYIKQVTLRSGDLPPVIDIEKLYGVKPALMRERVQEFLDMVEDYYQVKPIIYTYADFYERYLGTAFDKYPLWVAHYFELQRPRVGRNWHFWQYTEGGKVNGVRGKVDCNLFNGDSVRFRQMLIR